MKEAESKSWTMFLLRLGPEDTFFYENYLVNLAFRFLDKADPSNEGYSVVDFPPTELVETLSTFI